MTTSPSPQRSCANPSQPRLQPGDAQATDVQVRNPQPTNPQPTNPQPTNPQPAGVAPAPPVRPSAYPVEPTIYPHALRSPRSRWWKGALAIVLLVIGYLMTSTILGIAAMAFDVVTGRTTWESYSTSMQMTPALFLATNVSLAAMLPLAVGLQALMFGQRPRFMSSVRGRFRWAWLVKAAVVVVPVYLVYTVAFVQLSGTPQTGGTDVAAFLIIIVLTTPLQAAGEEYAARGLINRAAGSWFAKPITALVVGGLINSALFMLAHGSTDPWLLTYYFFFGAIMTVLAWRTGGLEVPVLLHGVNNVFMLIAAVLAGQMNGLMERGAGAGSPVMLVPMAVALITVGLVEWRARRVGVVTTTTPSPQPPPVALTATLTSSRPTSATDQAF